MNTPKITMLLHGGAWLNSDFSLLIGYHNYNYPDSNYRTMGFRIKLRKL